MGWGRNLKLGSVLGRKTLLFKNSPLCVSLAHSRPCHRAQVQRDKRLLWGVYPGQKRGFHARVDHFLTSPKCPVIQTLADYLSSFVWWRTVFPDIHLFMDCGFHRDSKGFVS